MPSNFLSKFSKYASTTPDTPASRSPHQRGRSISGSIDATPAPRLVLTSDTNDSSIPPPSPGSIHRANSPAIESEHGQQRSESRINGRRALSVSEGISPTSASGTAIPMPMPSPRKTASDAIVMPHTTSPTQADFSATSQGLGIDLGLANGSAAVGNDVTDRSVKHKTSARSIRSQAHEDATPAEAEQSTRRGSVVSNVPMQPIVESPTADRTAFISHSNNGAGQPGLLSARGPSDSDSVSLRSANTSSGTGKKKGWGRGSTKQQQRGLSGLASAIAQSGLAMANPGMAMPNPLVPSSPYGNAAPGSRSPPKGTTKERSNSLNSVVAQSRSRQTSASFASTHSGGDEGGEFDSEMSSSDDELDLNEDDIPVTGFAVASSKRNFDFHELFPAVPEGDYLIEDYGCALQREILIQGRFYISENHICFHANIFGWITDLIIPVYEITSLEKKMTAFVIPNAIQITTRTTKYTFASFLSRDTTYDVIHNIWRLARPDAEAMSVGSGGTSARGSMDDTRLGRPAMDNVRDLEGHPALQVAESTGRPRETHPVRKVTQCACGREKKHYSETAMEVVLPGTPEKIYNLMFASGFIKDFMREEQKLTDVQISDWCMEPGSKLLSRNFSYVKPLPGGLGPKQAKCELKDETVHCDFDDYVATITTTRTPDVPSGGVFAVKTRTCIMWASAASTRVIVTTQVEWSGRSFIKSIIERSAIDGQKTYHADLERSMRAYITKHRSEFVPEGLDAVEDEAIIPPVESVNALTSMSGDIPVTPGADPGKMREQERNQRGLQWAWDTVMGTWTVAKQSTTGALDLISDAWDQSSSTTILIFVIVVLVISNIWTLVMVGRQEKVGRRKEMRKVEERERWVQGVVAKLWEEMAAGRGPVYEGAPVSTGPWDRKDWRDDVGEINKALDAVEERVKRLRKGLQELD